MPSQRSQLAGALRESGHRGLADVEVLDKVEELRLGEGVAHGFQIVLATKMHADNGCNGG